MHCARKWSFPLKIYSENMNFPADLVTFTEEILTGKLHFLCGDESNSFLFVNATKIYQFKAKESETKPIFCVSLIFW